MVPSRNDDFLLQLFIFPHKDFAIGKKKKAPDGKKRAWERPMRKKGRKSQERGGDIGKGRGT